MNPIVTIVITTRDRHEQLKHAVDSALAQTVDAIEVIVVDDASAEPVRPPSIDRRLRVERLKASRGTCGARNHGLARASGAWIVFLDDDDELDSTAVENLLEAADRSRLSRPLGVMSAVEIVDSAGRVIEVRSPRQDVPAGENSEGPSGIFNALLLPTAVLREIGGWDQRAHPWEHTELFMRMAPVCSLQGTPQVTYRLHDHPGERRHRDWLAGADALRWTEQKHRSLLRRSPERRARLLSSAGALYLKADRWGTAVRTMSRAVVVGRFRPRLLAWWLAAAGGPWVLTVRRRLLGRRSRPAAAPDVIIPEEARR